MQGCEKCQSEWDSGAMFAKCPLLLVYSAICFDVSSQPPCAHNMLVAMQYCTIHHIVMVFPQNLTPAYLGDAGPCRRCPATPNVSLTRTCVPRTAPSTCVMAGCLLP